MSHLLLTMALEQTRKFFASRSFLCMARQEPSASVSYTERMTRDVEERALNRLARKFAESVSLQIIPHGNTVYPNAFTGKHAVVGSEGISAKKIHPDDWRLI